MAKTIFFEKRYGALPGSTHEVDAIIEASIGRPLGVVRTDVFPIEKYDIERKLEEALAEPKPGIFYRFMQYIGMCR